MLNINVYSHTHHKIQAIEDKVLLISHQSQNSTSVYPPATATREVATESGKDKNRAYLTNLNIAHVSRQVCCILII